MMRTIEEGEESGFSIARPVVRRDRLEAYPTLVLGVVTVGCTRFAVKPKRMPYFTRCTTRRKRM